MKNLFKDFLRDIGRAIAAWLNTENGKAFLNSFRKAYLESSAKAQERVRDSMGK